MLDEISRSFKQFVESISPLTTHNYSAEELAEILIEWLISIVNGDILKSEIVKSSKIEADAHDVKSRTAAGYEVMKNFSRAVRKAPFDTKSNFTGVLCTLASIGLLTEVVQDFIKPTAPITQAKLCVLRQSCRNGFAWG
ncbi:MAG: hypothetical protein R3C58_03640 [Parvularculaceae bacterium]